MTLTATSAATRVFRNCFPLRDSLAERESPRNASCGWVRQLIHAGAAPASRVAIHRQQYCKRRSHPVHLEVAAEVQRLRQKSLQDRDDHRGQQNSQGTTDRSQHAQLLAWRPAAGRFDWLPARKPPPSPAGDLRRGREEDS